MLLILHGKSEHYIQKQNHHEKSVVHIDVHSRDAGGRHES